MTTKRLMILNGALALVLASLLLIVRATAAEGPPPALEPGQLLYVTTFDAFNDEWGLYPGRKSAQVVGGGLQVSIGIPNDGAFSPLDRQFGDFDMTVEATQLAGPDDNGYGVVFRHQDERSFYYFLISGDGYYQVTRQNGDEVKTLTADWRSSEYINLGQATNAVRVVGRGDHFTFFVNGHQLADLCLGEHVVASTCAGGELSDVLIDPTFAYGRVGVAALSFSQAGVVIGFDNLVVLGPE
jgi:hypothetical protein